MKQPVLSIVVPIYNAGSQLERFILSLKRQLFPRNSLELLLIDGGSTDNSLDIAKKYHIKIIHNPLKLAEPGVVRGFEEAKGELVMVLATDNIYKEKDALKKMVEVFRNKDIIAAFPKHDTASEDSVYSRYVNTFTDPFTHFVYGKAANARTFKDMYKTIEHTGVYDVYDYLSNKARPLIALAQGFTIRRSYMINREEQYDDVLAVYGIIQKNRHIAYVFSVSLYHYTVSDLGQFVHKQTRAVENAFLRGNSGITKRSRYLTNLQKVKQYLFIPYSISVVFPLLFGLYYFIISGEHMWLWHPYMTFISAVVICKTTLYLTVKNIKT